MLNMAYGCISNINSLRENKGVKSKREYKMQRDKSNFGQKVGGVGPCDEIFIVKSDKEKQDWNIFG